MSNVFVFGTLILNSDMACTGTVTVQASGKIIPVANEVIDTLLSCPTKDFISSNGKSPTVTAMDINVIGQINGNEAGFPANFGPGANSTLKDNWGIPILFYGATHAGVGYARNVPENYIFMSEEFVLDALQIDEESVILSYPSNNPSAVALNITTGPPQEYGTDFIIHGNNILTWRGYNIDSFLQEGDIIRVIYLGDELRIMPPAKPPYGNYEEPLSIGSGSGEVAGGSGIRLIAETVTVNGSITMNGGTGTTIRSGGGSGGSVWIIARDITGSGLISARGGDATYEYAGGGGGGYLTFTYENSYTFNGILDVDGPNGASKGIIWFDQPKSFFIEKFTGHVLNTKWWELVQQPVVLNNQVEMDTTTGDLRSPFLQSKFGLSGKNILTDLEYNPIGSELSNSYNAYFRLYVDADNWIGIAKRIGYIFGVVTTDGIPSQIGVPYTYVPTKFRFSKTDSTFSFQFVDSSTGIQTICSQVLPEFENSKFFTRIGMHQPDTSRIIDYFRLSTADIINKNILLSSLPIDSTIAMNFLHGTSQYYGTDFYVDGQFLKWDSMALDGTVQAGDEIEVQYITSLIQGNIYTRWDNLEIFNGILHDIETREPIIYVDSVYGSDANDGLRLTPLQNLFVATAWAKRRGTVVLYDGTYNPTEVVDKTLTIMGANGASPLITTDNVQDSTGSNWENSCFTFRNCQGVVKNISMTHAVDALYAENTNGLEISSCTIADSTRGVRFNKYTYNPKILRNTIHGVVTAVDMSSQVYDPYIYSNVIYDVNSSVMMTDATGVTISSNTIDRAVYGVFFDETSMGSIASNNITNSTIGVMATGDSTAVVYNNNFFNTTTNYTGNISEALWNIATDPQYINDASGNYHLLPTSPDRTTGLSTYDQYYLDRDNVSRTDSYAIGAYEVIDGSHGTGPYYVDSSGDDYRNFGTATDPYRTLDKAISVADNTVIIEKGHYDSYYLKLRSKNIQLDASSIFTLDSHYSNINVNSLIYVSPNGSDSSVWGGDGTHTWGNGSRQYPYRTIDRALQDASVAGTSLIVMSGEYNIFSGRDDVVLVPFSDRTAVSLGRYYLQSLFETFETTYTNHVYVPGKDKVWNIYTAGRSEASIQNGFLTLAYDGTNTCGADSTFTFMAPFTAQANVQQAFDPIFFRVCNQDNTAVVQYNNGDWTSTVTTGGHTSSCWGHIDTTSASDGSYAFFTDYVCISSEDIANKYVPLTYLFTDGSNVAVNLVGGGTQYEGADYIAEDGKIKWDGLGLESELTPGEILRVIYRAQGLLSPVQFQISLLPNGILEVRGSDRRRWSRLMQRRLYSDTSSPWSSSFYMDRTVSAVDRSLVFGRGYVSQYYTMATSFEGTDQAVPYQMKTWRQPIILHNPTVDNT